MLRPAFPLLLAAACATSSTDDKADTDTDTDVVDTDVVDTDTDEVDTDTVDTDTVDTDTDLSPTFTLVRATVLTVTCTNEYCHGAGAGGMTLTGEASDWNQLVGVASVGKPGATRVVAGDPDASYIVQKLEGAVGIVGDPMPQGMGALDADDIRLVREWIAAGAMND